MTSKRLRFAVQLRNQFFNVSNRLEIRCVFFQYELKIIFCYFQRKCKRYPPSSVAITIRLHTQKTNADDIFMKSAEIANAAAAAAFYAALKLQNYFTST